MSGSTDFCFVFCLLMLWTIGDCYMEHMYHLLDIGFVMKMCCGKMVRQWGRDPSVLAYFHSMFPLIETTN